RDHGRSLLWLRLVFHGLHHRAQGLHCRGDRRHRLDPRCNAGWPGARPARKLRHADPRHRQRMEGRVLFLGADPGAGVQAHRPPRQIRAGAHVMALEPGSPGPQSVEARPSAWGGLSAILDTPQKRGITIVVILAAMVIAPQAFGPYATVILTNALLYTILA